MYLQELEVTDYRNIETARIGLTAGTTIFVGTNGQGKTNLLESMVYAARLSSHRVSSDAALVRSGRERAELSATFRFGRRRSVVEVTIPRSGANLIRLNGSAARRRTVIGQFPVALFAPGDLALVTGDPSERRDFLNEVGVELRPSFADVLTQYERVLRQRNSLLRSARSVGHGKAKLATLVDWDEQLAHFGAQIIHRRTETVGAMAPLIAAAYQDIAASGEVVGIDVDSSVAPSADQAETAARFLAALEEQRANEIDRGLTLVGPHRDDLALSLSGLAARSHASHGESWSLALALRLGSARLLRQVSRVGDPILLLDDVFAELDKPRRLRLAGSIGDFEQVIITAAVEDELPPIDEARRVPVRAGVIGGR